MTVMNQSEFARHIGNTRGYVNQLKHAGRLVMAGDLVDVDASLKLIEETKDISKAAVVERHAAERQAKMEKTEPAQNSLSEAVLSLSAGEKAGSVYQQSRALKEKYNAMAAKRDYELSVGKLFIADDVLKANSNAVAVCKIRGESLAYSLAPQFAAEADEQKILLMFLDGLDYMWQELSNHFDKLAKQEK